MKDLPKLHLILTVVLIVAVAALSYLNWRHAGDTKAMAEAIVTIQETEILQLQLQTTPCVETNEDELKSSDVRTLEAQRR